MSATLDDVLAGRSRWAVLRADNAVVLPTLPERSVDHVITDPPYTQRTSKNARRGTNGHQRETIGAVEAFITFDGVDGMEAALAREFLRIAARWSVVWCALEQIGAYAAAAGGGWVRAGAWNRVNGAPQFTGDRPAQAVEGMAIMHRPGRKRWNGGGKRGLWEHATEKDAKTIGHPTPKPLDLMIEVLADFTDPGDLILDPFCGSGTTGVACLRLGRRFIGVERDERYAAIARERLAAESQGLSLRTRERDSRACSGDAHPAQPETGRVSARYDAAMTHDELRLFAAQQDGRRFDLATQTYYSQTGMAVSSEYLAAMSGQQVRSAIGLLDAARNRQQLAAQQATNRDAALRAVQQPPPEPRPALYMLGRCAVEGEPDGMTLAIRVPFIVEVAPLPLWMRALSWLLASVTPAR